MSFLIAASAPLISSVKKSWNAAPAGPRASPTVTLSPSKARVMRAPACSEDLAMRSAVSPYLSPSSATKRTKSGMPTLPSSNNLSSCWVETPMLVANKANAPGRRSPSWPRSSSAVTLPLLNTWAVAVRAALTCSLLPPVARMAAVTLLKASLAWLIVPPEPTTAAESWVKLWVLSLRGMLKRSEICWVVWIAAL